MPFTPIAGTLYSYVQIKVPQGSHVIAATTRSVIHVRHWSGGRVCQHGRRRVKVLNGLLVTTNDVDYGGVWVDSCKDSTIVFANIGAAPITVMETGVRRFRRRRFLHHRRRSAVYARSGRFAYRHREILSRRTGRERYRERTDHQQRRRASHHHIARHGLGRRLW